MAKTSKKTLSLGDVAPQFTLHDERGKTVGSSDFKGKSGLVLFFYPGDMTPGCTMQLCAVRDDWQKFKKSDIAVFGINSGEPESHAKFKEKYGFPFPLLVDAQKKVSERFGAVGHIFKAKITRRTVVGINKDGRIVFLKRGIPKNSDILKAFSNK